MREIKFRAWDEAKKVMVYMDGHSNFQFWRGGYGVRYGGILLAGNQGLKDMGDESRWIENIPLMQFTGLLDKLGKEIYEGDILRCTDIGHEYNAQMVWEDAGFWILDDNKKPHLPYQDYREVIGNIYENPELL